MAGTPVLHIVCGKIAAGKSTLTTELARAPGTILVREDAWLVRLYPGEQESLADYIRNSTRLRSAIQPHLVALLRAGLSVVLDFPANTPVARGWMRSVFEDAGVAHRLHFLDVPDAVCRARLHRRNRAADHEYVVDDDQFDQFTRRFVAPSPAEGFTIVRHMPAPDEGA
jgi:predicted kinase